MIFSILPSSITTLFLSLNLLTAISFKDEVNSYYYGGQKDDIFVELSNSNRTLVMKAKKIEIDTNLLIVTTRNRYNFRIKTSDISPHEFIEIEDAQVNTNFKKLNETLTYEILEGNSCVMFVNKTKNSIMVNGIKVVSKEYFSKGVPLIINGIRVLN